MFITHFLRFQTNYTAGGNWIGVQARHLNLLLTHIANAIHALSHAFERAFDLTDLYCALVLVRDGDLLLCQRIDARHTTNSDLIQSHHSRCIASQGDFLLNLFAPRDEVGMQRGQFVRIHYLIINIERVVALSSRNAVLPLNNRCHLECPCVPMTNKSMAFPAS